LIQFEALVVVRCSASGGKSNEEPVPIGAVDAMHGEDRHTLDLTNQRCDYGTAFIYQEGNDWRGSGDDPGGLRQRT
jgi:hypothetical protein